MSNFINVDNFGYAIMTKDDATGATYGAIKLVSGAVKISVQPTSGRSAFYADGVITEYGQVLGEIKISVDLSTVSLAVQADLLGHTLDGLGGMTCKATDVAPYVGFFYRRKKANGKFRYVKVLKALFGESKDDAETAVATPKFQNDQFDGVALPRTFDTMWRKYADADEVGYVDVSATWFASIEGAVDVTPPTITLSVPTTGATAVVVGTTYVWTFSESLNPSTVNSKNFYLIKDTDGSIVASSSVVYNDAAKTVTLTPASALTAATKYLAVSDNDTTDLAGNSLVTNTRIFTTA